MIEEQRAIIRQGQIHNSVSGKKKNQNSKYWV